MDAVGELTLADFEPLVGQCFRIGEGADVFDARLIQAVDLRESQGVGRRSRQFSLIWRGPPQMRIEQRIHRVQHPEFAPLDLFLVCIGPDAQGMRYEAVFT